MRRREPRGLHGSGRAARSRARREQALTAVDAAAALRTRLGARPRRTVLVDVRGPLTGGELLDLVRLHRSGADRSHSPGAAGGRTADDAGTASGIAALPAAAPLRQVLVTALVGGGTLTPRSSGSTGAPRSRARGPLTPAQLLTLLDLGRRIGLRPGRRIACAAPGVHGHGLVAALGALALGAPLIDLSHLPAPERVTLLHRTSPDVLTGVPVHLSDLLQADREHSGGRPLRIPRIVSGSDVLAPSLRADLSRHFRGRVHDVYGTTETGSLSVDGRPLRGVHLRELDGLLCARTPFTSGRELVTDRGEITADGTVRVLGRADGTVSSGGMLHDPAATARVLRSHEGVAAARLRLVPDPRHGVRTLAEVTLAPSSPGAFTPSAEELRALVRDRLGAAAVPREVRFVGDGEPPSGPLSSPGR